MVANHIVKRKIFAFVVAVILRSLLAGHLPLFVFIKMP